MRNRFVSEFWTKPNLLKFLESVETMRITGKPIRVRTSRDMETDFDPKSVDLDKIHDELLYALHLLDPDNYDNPYSQKRMRVHSSYFHTYGGILPES